MPRLNTGVQGSPIVTTVLPKDRLTDGRAGSPVFVGPAVALTRRTPGLAGSSFAAGAPIPEAPAVHLYWRIYITATQSGGHCAITEVEMFDADGVSLCSGGTASASSTGFGLVAADAFDGNFDGSNMWHSNNGSPSEGSPDWLRYQFASAVSVASIRITPRGNTGYNPTTFKVQYSDDGSAWTDAASFSTGSWPNLLSRSFAVSAATGEYVAWRLNVTATQSTGATSAAEVGFRETPAGSVESTSTARYIHAGSTFGGTAAANAFDGNASTLWSASGSLPNWWIGYHFARPLAIGQVYWTARNDGSHTQSPTALELQGSNDGGFTWTTIESFTSPADWTAGETRTFTV